MMLFERTLTRLFENGIKAVSTSYRNGTLRLIQTDIFNKEGKLIINRGKTLARTSFPGGRVNLRDELFKYPVTEKGAQKILAEEPTKEALQLAKHKKTIYENGVINKSETLSVLNPCTNPFRQVSYPKTYVRAPYDCD